MELTGLIFAALSSAKKANERIDTLPLPMVFKGTLGTGGTISTLPTASTENEGYVYIVITDGTYAGQAAKAGDTFVSDGSSWVLVPSGDEPSVIDDSVTSTALTWSSKKISDECKVKSFTYAGTGLPTNEIAFTELPKTILSIEGYLNNSNIQWCVTTPINWGVTQAGLERVIKFDNYVVSQFGFITSFDNTDKKLSITSSAGYSSMNSNGVTYTVYYI